MIVLAGAIFGATLGALIAYRRKGNRWDMLHYGAIYGLAFTLIGLFVTIAIHRAVVM
jgi:hypothetical protein